MTLAGFRITRDCSTCFLGGFVYELWIFRYSDRQLFIG